MIQTLTHDEWFDLGCEIKSIRNDCFNITKHIELRFGVSHNMYARISSVLKGCIETLKDKLDSVVCGVYMNHGRLLHGHNITITSVFYGEIDHISDFKWSENMERKTLSDEEYEFINDHISWFISYIEKVTLKVYGGRKNFATKMIKRLEDLKEYINDYRYR